jgi:mono/diheme cytochrome c family protein
MESAWRSGRDGPSRPGHGETNPPGSVLPSPKPCPTVPERRCPGVGAAPATEDHSLDTRPTLLPSPAVLWTLALGALTLGGGVGMPLGAGSDRPDFGALRLEGARRSQYQGGAAGPEGPAELTTDLESFRREIEPLLESACLGCHGPDKEKGGFRLDELDPDLVGGEDVDWWLDVLSVVSNGEMPPADGPELAAADRGQVVEWLSTEVQTASLALRAQGEHSTFRRLARYEYSHALQDLLGLPLRFGEDLPPDPISEDGFQNSSEVLHLSSSQLPTYLEAGREALRAAAPLGDRPAPVVWSISMDAAADREWQHQEGQLEGVRKKHEADPAKLEEELGKLRERFARRPGGAHFQDPAGTRFAGMRWNYNGARFAWAPSEGAPAPTADSRSVAVLPAWHGMTVELGDRVPDEGTLRVRVRASRASDEDPRPASLRLMFGWQASNDSNAVFPATDQEALVDAPPGAPQTYSWDVPMGDIYPRNLARGVNTMGQLPSPSEFIKLVNGSLSGRTLHIHHVEVEGPVFDQWPPASHRRIFHERPKGQAERAYAAEVIERFMARAWRRTPTRREVSRKVKLFRELRRDTDSVEEAVLEVLAVVLTSPNFLYVVVEEPEADPSAPISDLELATRLSLFLWCSAPDEALLQRARAGELREPGVLEAEVDRMLADPRAERFADRFVGQWLNLALMDNLEVNRKAYPAFDDRLQDAMVREPVEFFRELLRTDGSALDFIHSDFAMVNERLAAHYGLGDVTGNHFRRVELDPAGRRGGLLAQAGPLAMNSDGKDSHPLKRGIWMLENLLDDPPPPPPPAVPEIDLADPEIAKMTLKERIEDHRNDPACMSCHAKIDPWGIAFEQFDAIGQWRTEAGGRPVDARSVLFNQQVLDGLDGLKGFLLLNRQDQFVRALVQKLVTFGLGRPLGFSDRAEVDRITAETREAGDGLATMIKEIVTSDLFQSR